MIRREEGWIEVEVDGARGDSTERARFFGYWMAAPDDDNWSRLPGQPMSRCYGIGAGTDGSIYVYSYHLTEASPRSLVRFPSLADALEAGVAADVIAYAVGRDVARRGIPPARPAKAVNAARVLLLSADPARSHVYRRELEADGYTVDIAPDAARAGQILQRRRPVMLFVDVTDGTLDGVPSDGLVAASVDGRELPVVLITGAEETRRTRRLRLRLRVPA